MVKEIKKQIFLTLWKQLKKQIFWTSWKEVKKKKASEKS